MTTSEKISLFAIGISVVVLLVFAIQTTVLIDQTKISNEQFSLENRPWIAGDQITVFENSIQYDIQNFGKTPNKLGETKFYTAIIFNVKTPVLRDDLPLKLFKTNPLTAVMPNQKMSISFTGDVMKAIDDVKNTEGELYLMIIMDYPYGNDKHGEYGFIGKYNPETNDFSLTDSWAS